jgi:Domain of unknown function (DUF6249)
MPTSTPKALITPVLAALAVAVLGESVAHAAPQLDSEVFERTWDVIELGVSCVDQLDAASNWLEIQVGGDPSASGTMRGFGVAFLAVAALVIIALGRMRLSAEHKRLDLARRLVEQGLEPPSGLLSAPARADLRRGLVLGFAGLGLVVAGWVLGDRGLSAGGMVPAFIGAGYLVSFRLARRMEQQ